MSTTDESATEVTTRDREIASLWLWAMDHQSNEELAEAFARHRTTERDRLLASQERAIADAVERCAKVAENQSDRILFAAGAVSATAIRNLKLNLEILK